MDDADCSSSSGAGADQRRLLKYLFEENKHDPLERPVKNDSETLTVTMSLALQQIIDFVSKNELLSPFHRRIFQDEKKETLVISGWLVLVSESALF